MSFKLLSHYLILQVCSGLKNRSTHAPSASAHPPIGGHTSGAEYSRTVRTVSVSRVSRVSMVSRVSVRDRVTVIFVTGGATVLGDGINDSTAMTRAGVAVVGVSNYITQYWLYA